jgi:hypothetical protein
MFQSFQKPALSLSKGSTASLRSTRGESLFNLENFIIASVATSVLLDQAQGFE